MRLYRLVVILLFVSFISFAQTDSVIRTKVLIMPVDIGPNCDYMSPNELYEAGRFAVNLSKNYEAIEKDKITRTIRENQSVLVKTVDFSKIAKSLNSEYIAFSSVKRIGNVVRTELILKSSGDTSIQKKGIGYEMLNLRDITTDNPIYVPTVIGAYQKAFAAALKDTMMYDDYRNAYRVFPSSPMAICGIDFVESKKTKNWKLFDFKQTASYDILESIFKVTMYDYRYFTYDIATRDSIYAVFGLHEKLNFNAPSQSEIIALYNYQIKNFLTGEFRYNKDEKCLEIELMLFGFSDEGEVKKIDSHSELIKEDNVDYLRYAVQKTATRLLFGKDIPIPDYQNIED